MKSINPAGIVAAANKKTLDPVQLQILEQIFHAWADSPASAPRRLSRRRVLLIFLLIRYTGAKLNEVLTLHPLSDIDLCNRKILLRRRDKKSGGSREVQMPELLAGQIKSLLEELCPSSSPPEHFRIDPAHVRRKFYECAEAAGLPREMGTPEAIRRSRAVELMQSNVPLPVVQKIMGHSTPNLAASYVQFSEEEIRRVERFHIERENKRKTSARNSFFGKIEKVRTGDVQAAVEILSLEGQRIHATVTKESQNRLGLAPGALVAVEVKAPWVILHKGGQEPLCSAENRFTGSVSQVHKGKINSEVVVRISGNTELCSVLTEKSRKALQIEKGDIVWAVFNASMAVIHVE